MRQARAQEPSDRNPAVRRARPAKVKALPARVAWTEGEFARFFDQSLDLHCIAGFDGYFKRLNPEWTAHLGWSLKELESTPFLEFVHPDDREATQSEVGRLATGAVTVLFENRYRHRDGSYRWLQWTGRPLARGERIYATARDVTRQKRLEREILEIVDRERERLGRDLHDGLCQMLAGIAALSATLSRKLAGRAATAESVDADEITRLLHESIGVARDLARGLGPAALNSAGLSGALESLAKNVRNRFRVSCAFARDRDLPVLDQEVEGHLYRIAQEAVNNAIAHGRPRRINISLACKDGKGLLRIRDNGVGVGDGARNTNGIGLHTMGYRAQLIGGRFDIRRGPRKGTAVTCVFPLPSATGVSESHVR